MVKKNIYGKTGKHFCKVAEDSLEGVWDYGFKECDEQIDFMKNSSYKLEDNEIFYLETTNKDLAEYLNVMENTTLCNFVTKNDLKKLETLYVFEGTKGNFHLYIQRVMPSARIEKTIISFNPDIKLAHIEKDRIYILICNKTYLYWNQAEQKIYFKKFSDLESVFPSFSKYYREATQEDIEKFKDDTKYPFLNVQISDFTSLSKRRLQKIAKIVDELDRVKENFEEYKSYALKYKENFIKNDKFEINSAKDIEHLAEVVFRKIYTTEAGEEEIRVANSYKIIKKE